MIVNCCTDYVVLVDNNADNNDNNNAVYCLRCTLPKNLLKGTRSVLVLDTVTLRVPLRISLY